MYGMLIISITYPLLFTCTQLWMLNVISEVVYNSHPAENVYNQFLGEFMGLLSLWNQVISVVRGTR